MYSESRLVDTRRLQNVPKNVLRKENFIAGVVFTPSLDGRNGPVIIEKDIG